MLKPVQAGINKSLDLKEYMVKVKDLLFWYQRMMKSYFVFTNGKNTIILQ